MLRVFSTILLTGFFGLCAAHTSIEVPKNEIKFEAIPTQLSLTLGGTLSLRCEIPARKTTGWTRYDAIFISRVVSDKIPKTVATVSSIDKDLALCGAGVKAEISGRLEKSEGGYLKVSFQKYSLKDAGSYSCFVKGRDASSFEITLSKKVEIISEKPTLEKLLWFVLLLQDKSRRNEMRIKALESSKTNDSKEKQNEEVNKPDKPKMKDSIDTPKVVDDDDQIVTIQIDSKKSLSLKFVQSSVFKGHLYRLFRALRQNLSTSKIFCETMGGYLAEINDRAEFLFIKQFLTSIPPPGLGFIFVGLSDEEQENKWVFLKNKNDPVYIFFGDTEPNGGKRENYIAFSKPGYQYLDISDTYGSRHYHSFLCEVPHHD